MASVSKTLTFQIILSSATNRKQQQSRLPKNSSRVLTFSSSSLYSAIQGVAPMWLQDVNPWFSISMQPITSSTLTFKENFFVVKTDNLPLRDDDKFQCRWRLGGTAADIEDEPKQKKRDIKQKSWNILHPNVYTVIVGASFCVALALCSFMLPSKIRASRYVVVPYSDLLSVIRDGSVDRVQFVEDSSQIFFNKKSLGDPSAETSQGNSLTSMEGKPRWQYATRNVDDDKHDLLVMLDEMGITYGADPGLVSASTKDMLFVLFQLAPCWILVFLTCYQILSQLSVGKSNAKKLSEKPSVAFSDVEGVDAAKAELLEIVLCMKGESKYTKLGAKVPKGVLLAGPPGTGKTLLARAIAGEAGVSFFSISASELVEIFVGMGAARVRDLFHEARKHSPSIVFIDEIDAVGKHRGRSSNAEYDQTLNQLLTEMDGFEKDSNVVVIAATNRPEMLDAALLRPGRFSRKVQVDEPDNDGRRKIFGIYLRNIITEEDKDELCELVAGLTPGLVGADLENIASEAVLLAARRGDDCVKREDFVLACERANTKLHSYSSKPPYQPRMDSGVASGYAMF